MAHTDFKVGDKVGVKVGGHGVLHEDTITEIKLYSSSYKILPDGTEEPIIGLHAFFDNGKWFPLEYDFFTSRYIYELVKL